MTKLPAPGNGHPRKIQTQPCSAQLLDGGRALLSLECHQMCGECWVVGKVEYPRMKIGLLIHKIIYIGPERTGNKLTELLRET